jgi:HK97 family phage major capsid protein
VQKGVAPTLFGAPVYTDPSIPDTATGNNAVLSGDWSKYWIRVVNGVRLESSEHYAWDRDVTTYRAKIRLDAKLIDPSAIKAITMA